MKKSDPPIITKQTFTTTRSKLWNAITNPIEMKKWYFEILPDFKAEVGFKTNFHLSVEDRSFTHQWEILEVIPKELIRYSWQYDEHPGDSHITYKITGEDGSLNLEVICEILKDFPQDLPEFKRESAVAGWKYFIHERLGEYLEE